MRNQSGFTLIQTMMVAAGLAALALTATTLYQGMQRNNNGLEFQARREELRMIILGQFLTAPDNCACLFRSSGSFPATGTPSLAATDRQTIGNYQLATPGNCTGATIPSPWATSDPKATFRIEHIHMENIRQVSGRYSGDLVLMLHYNQKLTGKSDFKLSIPVAIEAQVSGGQATIRNCSTSDQNPNTNLLSVPDVIFCLGSCGNSWPHVLGGVADTNDVSDVALGPACSGTIRDWGDHSSTLYLCGRAPINP